MHVYVCMLYVHQWSYNVRNLVVVCFVVVWQTRFVSPTSSKHADRQASCRTKHTHCVIIWQQWTTSNTSTVLRIRYRNVLLCDYTYRIHVVCMTLIKLNKRRSVGCKQKNAPVFTHCRWCCSFHSYHPNTDHQLYTLSVQDTTDRKEKPNKDLCTYILHTNRTGPITILFK